MDTKNSRINREIGLEIQQAKVRARPRRSVKWLAANSGISDATINRMWSDDPRDINITQITWLAALLGADPIAIVRDAVEKAGGMGAVLAEAKIAAEEAECERETAVSDDAGKKDDLATRRAQREAEEMSVAEIEESATAATIDPELDSDEPEAP
jgi:DNA-binding Xre family transcriptional regulator